MGQNLLNQAASQPPHIKKSLEELLDMTVLNELWVFDEIVMMNNLHDDKWNFLKLCFAFWVPAFHVQ